MSAGDVNGHSFSVSNSSVTLSAPFGDALANSFDERKVMVLDQLNAPFFADLSAFESRTSANYTHRHLNQFLRHLQYAAPHSRSTMLSEWLGLVGVSMRFNNTAVALSEDERVAYSRSIPLASKKSVSPILTLAAVHEPESTLGAHTKGAFGKQRSASLVTELSREQHWRGWDTTASIATSLTSIDSDDGFIRYTSPVIASRFGLDAERKIDDTKFRCSVSQPLRVEAGRAQVRYPVARTPDRQVVYEIFQTDLTPSERQVDIDFSATHSISPSAKLALKVWVTSNPEHIEKAKSISGLSLGFVSRF